MNDSRTSLQNPPFMSHSLRPMIKVTFLQEPTYESNYLERRGQADCINIYSFEETHSQRDAIHGTRAVSSV